MPAVNKNVERVLHCPTCAKEMAVTSVTPTSAGAIYGYQCDDDGDRLSWQPRAKKGGGSEHALGPN